MNYRLLKTGLLAGAAISGAAFSTSAIAQSAPEDDSATGDIIVTAQRVEQRLQDVPISITVFNQEQLSQRNVAVATDLATYTPSLSVNQRYGPEKSSFSIRGFNQDQSTAPTVGVYFAEVVGLRAQGGTTSGNSVGAGAFTDLQNVQILKGPQGTLFGRNTTGGAILLTPAKPTGDLEGYVEGTYGNYNQVKVGGALNVPLAETFKVRLAVERNKRDGYMKNVSGIGPKDYNDINYTYARLSMVADLTPDLENYTIFHYSKSNTNGYGSRQTGCATPTSPINPLNVTAGTAGYSGTRHLQATSCSIQVARQDARGDGLYKFETANPAPFLNLEQWQVINTTTWRVSDSMTLKNIVSYGEFRERANFDLGAANYEVAAVDNSPFPNDPRRGFLATRISPRLTTTGGAPGGLPLFIAAGTKYGRITLDTAGPNRDNSSQSTMTEELQLQGSAAGGKLTYVVGGYLEFARPIGYSEGRTGIFLNCTRPQDLACTNPLFFGSISESSTKLNFDNHGVFAQATYNFTEQLALTGGARYTMDKITGITNSTRASFSANAGTGPLIVDPVSGKSIARACTDSFRHLTEKPDLDRSGCITFLKNSSNKPTWLINLDYKPNADMMVYAKYARGYRQGGINFTNPGLELWGPESLDSYELGVKTSFRGAVSGYLNVAAFYNSLKDQQVFAGLTPSAAGAAVGVAGGAAIVNAGKSRIYGLEVDASATVFDSLRFDLGYTYLNTKVQDIASTAELLPLLDGTPFGNITPSVSKGSSFTNSPKHKLTLGATYTLPLDESLGRLSIGALWVHTSKYINDGAVPATVNGIPLGATPSTDLINANIDWRGVGGSPIDLSLFVTNITKEKFNVASTGAWNSAGVAEILLNQPRFYGVRVRFSFGD